MIIEEIRAELFRLRDAGYRDFQVKLLPTVDPEAAVGVRTPELRRLARATAARSDVGEFLDDLPHRYFDENQLHAFILSQIRDYGACLERVNLFLPHVDNWATCDQMSPKVFKKHRPELLDAIRGWIDSGATYTVRFGVGMLLEHFLDADFDPACLEWVAAIRSGEYYVRMMVAWYFATALAKQYDAAIPYIEERRLDGWTHNRTIRKAIESYRIAPEQKTTLRGLKVKAQRPAPGHRERKEETTC